jgi:membrane protein
MRTEGREQRIVALSPGYIAARHTAENARRTGMATDIEPPTPPADSGIVKQGAQTLQAFFTKFNNDWVMGFASALAFNLITAILPIFIAIVAIAGFTIGKLDLFAEQQLITHLQSIFPASGNFLSMAFASLKRNAGMLTLIAIFLALFGGSRLFVSMEGYFAIIYHTRTRTLLKQNIMAIVMLLLFLVLTAPMIFAASLPALFQVAFQDTIFNQIPGSSSFFGLLSILVSLGISWILFEAIYLVVPNQRIRFRNSWPGAVVAAVLLQLYLLLFPLYVTHFLVSYADKTASTTGLLVILLFFFYYFAVILLLGAEINAFFAEHIKATPDNLAAMVHTLTSYFPTTAKEMHEQATISHTPREPRERNPESKAEG